MNTPGKAIWIDVDNSPHVPLFAPVIEHYRDAGIGVIVTARDHSQTIALLDLHGFAGTYSVLGKHYGGNKLAKALGLIVRASELATHISSQTPNPLVAVSHGSRSMVLAAKWRGIPSITMYDYEWTETGVFNRFSRQVLVPDAIPDEVLDRINLPQSKRVKYAGIKEELYVSDFTPTPGFRERFLAEHGVSDNKSLVVLRPPATSANYHSPQSDQLFAAILTHLAHSPDILTVVVPRTRDQAAKIPVSSNLIILDEAIDGLELVYASDVVISGGGTMNREAVLLGVPVYSIFAGRQGAVDEAMEREGSIAFIREPGDVAKIVLTKRERPTEYKTTLTDRVERFVIDQIDPYLKG